MEEDYKKQQEFNETLKKTSLKTFKDRPEEVKFIRCIHATTSMLTLEWNAPGDNNCPIT
jgi:hypothetical protein